MRKHLLQSHDLLFREVTAIINYDVHGWNLLLKPFPK